MRVGTNWKERGLKGRGEKSEIAPFSFSEILNSKYGYMTLHLVTLNRATVKRRQLMGRQLTGATLNRSDR